MPDRVDHRPWPLPAGPWVMFQRWHDLLFAHWPVAVDDMRACVPPQLTLDDRDGSAWLAVTPFRMTDVRPRGLPALPWISAFPELNVRTYVTVGDKPGVYFFSLEASNPLAIAGARFLYHLPYYRAEMSVRAEGHAIHYASRRSHAGAPAAVFAARYEAVGQPFRAAPGSIEHWLTERYCLYAVDRRGRVYRGEIHHDPWPLQAARVDIATNTMTAPLRLSLPAEPALCHFARRLDVLVWPPERV